ncbi:YchJ family protein [Thalassotalea sp. PLHSN55]|uniref:YchJ family protein n=1 Tax=Thalassotalea sp. PLHSN55 TaxID=3435888 RepID=UPI003F8773B4
MKCPCGTSRPFEQCCFAIHNKRRSASSPEALMRSRYSAYATNNAQYIYDTYASKSQAQQSIDEIRESASDCRWLKLTIHSSTEGNDLTQQLPTVEFSAFYLIDDKLFEMHELSRFVQEQGAWRYLDGEIKANHQVAQLKRNDPCPCESGKKFKKCCSK